MSAALSTLSDGDRSVLWMLLLVALYVTQLVLLDIVSGLHNELRFGEE